jgi:hypothetical protein
MKWNYVKFIIIIIMKYITMTVFDKKYKIKAGITTVGNT